MARFLLVHGWAFDRSFWDRLCVLMPGDVFDVIDLGYFGRPTPALNAPNAPFIAVGHSAGFPWLLSRDLPGCVGYVGFNGFTRFSQAGDFPHGISPRVLARMSAALEKPGNSVVADFRARCGTVEPAGGEAASSLLASGLQDLARTDARQAATIKAARILILAGTLDPIVTPAMSKDSFAHQPDIAVEWAHAGHLLPWTHPSTCAALLMQAAEKFGA